MGDPIVATALVNAARLLERLLAKRRKKLEELTALDDAIRRTRKDIRDISEAEPFLPYSPLPGEHSER